MVEASLGASTDDDFFDELFFLLLLLSSSSSHHRHRRVEEFRGQGFLPGGHLLRVFLRVFNALPEAVKISENTTRTLRRFERYTVYELQRKVRSVINQESFAHKSFLLLFVRKLLKNCLKSA